MSLGDDLRGWVCQCEFDLPSSQWPVAGSPAWVVVMDADSGMVKMRGEHGPEFWISASKIKTIYAARKV